jgi:hypothetical protein
MLAGVARSTEWCSALKLSALAATQCSIPEKWIPEVSSQGPEVESALGP